MKTAAIIAEYNPFHNGHEYQIKMLKREFDRILVVMSGSFVQRGDVAIFDKWSRAKAAISSGANLVIELPAVFSVNTAERFAYGAVNLINGLNVVDALSFGSECNDILALTIAAQLMEEEPVEVSEKMKHYLGEGYGYPAAREMAFNGIIEGTLLSSPNNLLGIEYIRQLLRLKSQISPITHKRIGAGYHDLDANSQFMSAASIRTHILNKNYIHEGFENAPIHRIERLDNAVLYHIRKNGHAAFEGIADISEGIENRIISYAGKVSDIYSLIEGVSTKRYTKTKVSRIILSSLLGLDGKLSKRPAEYIRVLGSDSGGFELLSRIKLCSDLQIITKAADFKGFNEMFNKDILSTDIYDLTSDKPEGCGADFKNSPVIGGVQNG